MPGSKKRSREDDDEEEVKAQGKIESVHKQGGTSTNFRNVSACNRCRHRKNRCDQQLPRCSACSKANAQCVGFDPVSKREIPRSYVYFLETRVRRLEALLSEHNIPVPASEESFPIDEGIKPGVNVPFPPVDDDIKVKPRTFKTEIVIDPVLRRHDARQARKVTMSTDLRRTLPQTTMQPPGLSFSKVVFAAVRSSVSQTASERGGTKPSKPPSDVHAQDCFFGLLTKSSYKPAPFPDQELGFKLVDLYFEHANPQIPILHRGEFMDLFRRVYAKPDAERSSRELYLLKIVFAVGSGIIMDSGTSRRDINETADQKKQRFAAHQHQPEEYHASAVAHLDSFLHATSVMDGHGGGMEELQAVLLLAALALLRPVAPGLWYIIGVAVRLAVDLGLHFEEFDAELDILESRGELVPLGSPPGKKQWQRDLRRRLWWCVYSFDRLVSTCVGRPFGITDQVVTTEFPSLLPDEFITKAGFTQTPANMTGPTYKLVAYHYIRLRLLQSEILQVLQYRQAQKVRAIGANADNAYMHTRLPSPFLDRFSSFREWRADIDRRLGEWKDSAPDKESIGVSFQPLFLELNYWQAIIMLYRQSLAVPAPLAEELSATTGESVQSPGTVNKELKQDEQLVFLKIAQAGLMVIKTYRQLHRLKLVNYTFLATHHLFMSGISFLYALWHSPKVRSQLTLDDVDFIILAAISVLTDLIDKCPPAEACRDAFQRMSRATITMCMSTTGFGSVTTLGHMPVETPGSMTASPTTGMDYFSPRSTTSNPGSSTQRRTLPKFDMNLKDIFPDEEEVIHRSGYKPVEGEAKTQSGYSISDSQSYAHLADSINQAQPELSFDNLDFLDTYILNDSNQQSWSNGYELDLGFGTGGTAGSYDNNSWEDANGMTSSNGVDLFDGFFFGNGNNNGI